jgi:PEGA domain
LEGRLQRESHLPSAIETVIHQVPASPEGVSGPSVFADGFGVRFLGFDAEAGDPIEILAFDRELVQAAGFGSAVGVRVARLSSARHALFARVRRIERPAPGALLLVSDRVVGWRLADVLDIANRTRLTLDTSAVLNLVRQLVPAVALFGRHQRDLCVGNIAPERLVLTPQGRLVIAEYVLGEAIDKLELSRDDLWRRYRVAVAGSEPGGDGARSDVLAIGLVALSLLVGRRLREDEFPFAMGDLLELVTEKHGGDSRPLSPRLASWLARSLQLEGHKPLQSPKEAQLAFEELLATERDYVTSPALLEAFIQQFEQRAGPPLEPSRPVVETPAAKPAQPAEAPPVAEREPAPVPLLALPVGEKGEPSEASSAAPARPAMAPRVALDWSAEVPAPPPQAVHRQATDDDPTAAAGSSVYREPDPPAFQMASSSGGVQAPDLTSASNGRGDGEHEEPAIAEEVADAALGSALESASEAEIARVAPDASSIGRPPAWMPKALAGLVLLAVLESAGILWLWNRTATALIRDGELSVQSRPTAARVTLDDEDLGVTPVTARLAPGTYTLKVQAGSAEPRVIVVQIRPGVQTAQYLELQSAR